MVELEIFLGVKVCVCIYIYIYIYFENKFVCNMIYIKCVYNINKNKWFLTPNHEIHIYCFF